MYVCTCVVYAGVAVECSSILKACLNTTRLYVEKWIPCTVYLVNDSHTQAVLNHKIIRLIVGVCYIVF